MFFLLYNTKKSLTLKFRGMNFCFLIFWMLKYSVNIVVVLDITAARWSSPARLADVDQLGLLVQLGGHGLHYHLDAVCHRYGDRHQP